MNEVPEALEVYLFAAHGAAGCFVCHASAERLVEALIVGAFTLCPQHLLRAHVVGSEAAGLPHLTAKEGPAR